jgi:hypothetical protein
MNSTTNHFSRLEDFMGIQFVSNPTNLVDWVARSNPALSIIAGGQKAEPVDDETALRGILSAHFQPLEVVYLEPDARGQVSLTNVNAGIKPTLVEAERMSVEVTTDGPMMLTFATSFYHCWHAYVDGKATRVWRANYAFQAVEVPKGKHEVRLVYEDTAFRCGAIISICTLIAMAAGWFWMRRRVKKVDGEFLTMNDV